MLETMILNMADDLRAGYDLFGECIGRQRAAIDAYKAQFDDEVELLKTMDERRAERWCYYDMKKHGAIS